MSNFFSKLVYCSHLIISSNKIVQCLSWLSKIYLQEKKKITAVTMFFILGPLTEQGKRLYRPCSRPQITTILDKINGKPRPPPPLPPIKRQGNRGGFVFFWASPSIWLGGWGGGGGVCCSTLFCPRLQHLLKTLTMAT